MMTIRTCPLSSISYTFHYDPLDWTWWCEGVIIIIESTQKEIFFTLRCCTCKSNEIASLLHHSWSINFHISFTLCVCIHSVHNIKKIKTFLVLLKGKKRLLNRSDGNCFFVLSQSILCSFYLSAFAHICCISSCKLHGYFSSSHLYSVYG